MSENTMIKTHHVLGVVLGILGIVIALLLSLLLGVIAGAVAALLGLIAVLLGFQARKAGKGMGAIICGALAIILAVALCVTSANVIKELRRTAEESGLAPLVAQYADKPALGVLGLAIGAAQSGADISEITSQMDQLRDYQAGKLSIDTPAEATAAPTEAAGAAE